MEIINNVERDRESELADKISHFKKGAVVAAVLAVGGLGYIANLAMGTAHTKCMTYNGATRATLSFNGEQMAKGAGSYDHLVSGEKYSVTRIDYPFGMSGVKVAGEKCN